MTVVPFPSREPIEAIKARVLERIEELGDEFPKMGMAWLPAQISPGSNESEIVRVVQEVHGVPLTSRDPRSSSMVVLAGREILSCPLVKGARAGTRFVDLWPTLEGATGGDGLWKRFGPYALALLSRRPVETCFRETKKGMTALPGQEFCRSCGFVGWASGFRLGGACPSCGTERWSS